MLPLSIEAQPLLELVTAHKTIHCSSWCMLDVTVFTCDDWWHGPMSVVLGSCADTGLSWLLSQSTVPFRGLHFHLPRVTGLCEVPFPSPVVLQSQQLPLLLFPLPRVQLPHLFPSNPHHAWAMLVSRVLASHHHHSTGAGSGR